MKIKKALAILFAVILALGAFFVTAGADFGDYGGDSDYGDFDFDFDYDYDDDDDDDDYYYGGSYSSGSGGSGTSGGNYDYPGRTAASIVVCLVFLGGIIAVIVLVVRNSKASKAISAQTSRAVNSGATPANTSMLRNINEFAALDPGFSQQAFSEKIANLYVRFQNSWQAKNMENLRPYLSDALFAQCDMQLDNYRRNAQTNVVERIAVLGVDLQGWYSQGGGDYMVVRLKTRITDYVVDDRTRAIIRGSNTAEKFMEYEWTLARPTGKKTVNGSGLTAQNCPNCGAPININRSARCEYCGSILTTDNFDWVVCNIKGIAQRTVNR